MPAMMRLVPSPLALPGRSCTGTGVLVKQSKMTLVQDPSGSMVLTSLTPAAWIWSLYRMRSEGFRENLDRS